MAGEINLSTAAQYIKLRKQTLSEYVATEVIQLFRWSLWFTGGLTLILCIFDEVSIWSKIITPDQRLITEKIVLALIGASVVQVGAASAAIVASLFKTTSADLDKYDDDQIG